MGHGVLLRLSPVIAIATLYARVAAVPGIYTGPASRAYLYYTEKYKQLESGMKVTIAAR